MAPDTPVGDPAVDGKLVGNPGFDSIAREALTLFTARPPPERLPDIDPTHAPSGCPGLDYLPPRVTIDDRELHRLLEIYRVMPFRDSTPCVFIMAASIQNSLFAVARRNAEMYSALLERLLELRKLVRARIDRPYQLGLDAGPREPLPADVIELWPFTEHESWSSDVAAIRKRRAIVSEPRRLNPRDTVRSNSAGEAALAKTLVEIDRRLDGTKALGSARSRLPLVSQAIAELTRTTPASISNQTGVRTDPRWEADPLITHTEYVLYHGPYTVMLDGRGELYTLGGKLDSALLIGAIGDSVARQLQPPGLYVSLARTGDSNFRIDNGRFTKILFGGIGALLHAGVDVREHDYHLAIQEYMSMRWASGRYAAALVSESAFRPPELTVDLVRRRLPELVETTVPYVVAEVIALLRETYANWEVVVKDVAREVVAEAIREQAKAVVRRYLIKKIGVKMIPIANGVMALSEVAEGADERRRVRLMIHSVLMHAQGSGPDDTHIASKLVAKALVEQFREELIEAVVSAVSTHGKLEARSQRTLDHDAPSPPPPGTGAAPVVEHPMVPRGAPADSPPLGERRLTGQESAQAVTTPGSSPIAGGAPVAAIGSSKRQKQDDVADAPQGRVVRNPPDASVARNIDTPGSTRPLPKPSDPIWDRLIGPSNRGVPAETSRQEPASQVAAVAGAPPSSTPHPPVQSQTVASSAAAAGSTSGEPAPASSTPAVITGAKRRTSTGDPQVPVTRSGLSGAGQAHVPPSAPSGRHEAQVPPGAPSGRRPQAGSAASHPSGEHATDNRSIETTATGEAGVARVAQAAPAGPRRPALRSDNVKLNGDTAGTGGIHSIWAHREEDGSVRYEIKGVLRDPLERPHPDTPDFNTRVPRGSEIGYSDYQVSHLWGPGFGDEAMDGMMYAHRDVNQLYQNQDIENRLRERHEIAKAGGSVIELEAFALSYPANVRPGFQFLKEVRYRFRVRHPDGTSSEMGEVEIHCPAPWYPPMSPATRRKPKIHVRGGSSREWSL